MGVAGFNLILKVTSQLAAAAAKNFRREEKFSPKEFLKLSKHMDEQLKLAHKIIDVLDQAIRKICAILMRYNVDKPEILYAQVCILPKTKEDEQFQ